MNINMYVELYLSKKKFCYKKKNRDVPDYTKKEGKEYTIEGADIQTYFNYIPKGIKSVTHQDPKFFKFNSAKKITKAILTEEFIIPAAALGFVPESKLYEQGFFYQSHSKTYHLLRELTFKELDELREGPKLSSS